MRSSRTRVAMLSRLTAVVAFLLIGAVQTARAHQDGAAASPPSTCSGVGVGISIFPFRADGSPLGSGIVSNCEALFFKSTVNYQGSRTCAFESGTVTLTTPDGVPHTVASSVPCVGGTTNDPNSTSLNSGRGLCAGSPTSFPASQPGINYTVRNQDIVNAMCQGGSNNGLTCTSGANCPGGDCIGEVDVAATYSGSFNHTARIDSRGGTATNILPVLVKICTPINTGCEQAGCDATTFQCFDRHDTCKVANTGCEQAGCDPTLPFPGCFDRLNTCKVANTGCEQAGCDPTLPFPGCFDRQNTCKVANDGCEQAGCDPTQPFPGCFDRLNTCTVINNGCEHAGCDPTLPFPGCFDNRVRCTDPVCERCDPGTGQCVFDPTLDPSCQCSLCVSKTACVEAPPPAGGTCTGGAIAITISYTGPSIDGPTTVVVSGTSSTAVTTTYSLPSLHTGDILTKASENGFTLDATAHGQSKLGTKTNVTINGALEVFHTSCSCTATPETNLVVCDPICLDSSSPDNTTGSKGPGSPLWTLVSLKDPSLGVETCNSGTTGECQAGLPSTTSSCVGKVKQLQLEYDGGGCAAMNNSQAADKVKCTQNVNTPNASPVRLRATDGGGGTVWLDTGSATIAIGDTVTVSAANAGKTTLAADTVVNIFNASNTLIEKVQFKTDCSQPLSVGNVFGGLKVVGFTTDKGGSTAGGATVDYTYKIINTGTTPANNVTVQDDKLGTISGSPIASIPVGGMVTLTAQKVLNATTINTVTATCNNGLFSTQATAAVVGSCVLGYPYSSSNPLTSTVFNESEVLRAFRPLGAAGVNDRIQAFYSDEHAMLLGVSTSSASVSPFTPAPGKVSSFVLNPQVGDQTAKDPFGRPFFPALFLTDITDAPTVICTSSDPTPTRCHDWQWGGTAIPPDAVFGTWKAATKSGTTILTGTDPAKNDYNLDGSGTCTTPPSDTCPDPVPSGLVDQGYGAEARWNVSDLGLTPGHVYRAQFMVHDGDQNKTGGDVGQGCLTVFIQPPSPCP